jgi:tape measure domain-containing protein
MDRINSSTQRATSSIGRASSAVDTVSTRFSAAEGATSRLTQKVTRLAAAFLSFETVKKGMEISDTYTNINSKLSLITQNARQLKSLQNDIFAAADRARGSYTSMADTVAKLGIIAGKQFGSNQNIVKFTETMQKMFKIGGTPVANQAGALLQLQQAIGLGRLQGQDLRILAEDAPLVETAIAKYMGKSTGEVKKLGTEGKITSQVLINSILKYSDTVDKQMGKMKYTWGDYWNKIKNGAYKAFGGVFDNNSSVLGSQNFQNMINGIISSFSVLAKAANGVMTGIANIGGFVVQNWSLIAPIIGTVTAAVLLYNGALLVNNVIQGISTGIKTLATIASAAHGEKITEETLKTIGMTQAQLAFNATLYACPIAWIIGAIVVAIGAIYLVIAIVDKATHQAISATGVIVGAAFVVGAAFKNLYFLVADFFVGVWNMAQALIHNLGVGFPNLWTDLQTGFLGFVTMILNGVKAVADAINCIPGMKMDTSGLANMINSNTSKIAALQKNKGKYEDLGAAYMKGATTYKAFEGNWASSAYNAGYKVGQSFDKKVKSWTSGIGKITSGSTKNKSTGLGSAGKSGLGTSSNPATVKGTGADGTMKVNITDQDLQYMRDLAEKQYINKFSTAVLSPKLNVSFSGNVGDKNDQKQIYSTISRMLKEELATAAEGYYPV